MNLLEQPDEVRTTFAFWQVFRSLGFENDDLYVGIVGGRTIVQVEQGGKTYAISMGDTRMTQEEFTPLWAALSGALPDFDITDLKANYEEWVTPSRWEATVTALVSAGVEIPAHRMHMN